MKDDAVFIGLTLTHDNEYDRESWQSILSSGTAILKDEQQLSKLSPPFSDVVTLDETSGVHGSLTINIQAKK